MKKINFIVTLVVIVILVACSPKIIEVTRIVEVTHSPALKDVVEVTRIIEVPNVVTREVIVEVVVEVPVEVTRVVHETVVVEVPAREYTSEIPSISTTIPSISTTWNVSTSGSDATGNGSESNPFATIQHGIDVAHDGETVLVHAGTYTENINFNGKNITVASLFHTIRDEQYISQTIINGDHNGRVVTFENGEGPTAVLSGFTITNGYVNGTGIEGSGGGIACLSSSPSLMHLKVSENEAVDEGGGLYFVHSSSSLLNTTVTNNTSYGGGGLRYSYGTPTIENVTVAANTAHSSGGGIFFYHADAVVKNVVIANNVANDDLGGDGGGGLYFDGCNPDFVNVTIVGNSTSGGGGGLHVSFDSHPNIVNTIVWGNTPDQIYFDTDWGGQAITIKYSNIQRGCSGIVTNGQGPVHCGADVIDSDPLFIDFNRGDYHVSNFSPVIGAGTFVDEMLPFDIEGNFRPAPANSNPDMGAYEHRQ